MLTVFKKTANAQQDAMYTQYMFNALALNPAYAEAIREILAYTKNSSANDQVRYPGEHIKRIRALNLKEGIEVDRAIWESLDHLIADDSVI